MKKILYFVFFILPLSGFSQTHLYIDTTIISKDSLIKIVNKGQSTDEHNYRNEELKIYYRNKLSLKIKNPNITCIKDTGDKHMGIEHLNELPLIAAIEKIDSNLYVLLGYNTIYKATGKFIWILEIQNNKLLILKQIAVSAPRSPDKIEFFINKTDSSLVFFSHSNRANVYVYLIGNTCKETYRILPISYDTHYSFPGIHNPQLGYLKKEETRFYKVKYK